MPKIASVTTPGTREEIQEEYDFIDACMETKVFESAKNFMVEKGNRLLIIVSSRNQIQRFWTIYKSKHTEPSC